jgi:hypothetical protein
MKRIVIAGNYRQFCQWCSENQVYRRDPNVIFAGSIQRLRGIAGPVEVVRYGTWAYRTDITEIEANIAYIQERAR